MKNTHELEFSASARRALIQEATLAKSLSETGVTALLKAQHSQSGYYFQAFFSISIAIERMAKLVLALNHHRVHGTFPTQSTFKKYSHDLATLMSSVNEVVGCGSALGEEKPFSERERVVLGFLSNFSKSERYYNLNLLGSEDTGTFAGPIKAWFEAVVPFLPEQIKLTKDERIGVGFSQHLDASNLLIILNATSEDERSITTTHADVIQRIRADRANRAGAMSCILIFRYLSQIIDHQSTYPALGEFFEIWRYPLASLARRRDFTR